MKIPRKKKKAIKAAVKVILERDYYSPLIGKIKVSPGNSIILITKKVRIDTGYNPISGLNSMLMYAENIRKDKALKTELAQPIWMDKSNHCKNLLRSRYNGIPT